MCAGHLHDVQCHGCSGGFAALGSRLLSPASAGPPCLPAQRRVTHNLRNELPAQAAAALPCWRGHRVCRGSGCAAAAAPSPGAGALRQAGAGDPSLELKWGSAGRMSRGIPAGLCAAPRTRVDAARGRTASSGRCWLCAEGRQLPAGLRILLPVCTSAGLALGEVRGPGPCEPGEVVFGEGVPAPLPAESLIRFCSIYSPLASWCFPAASRTWFPFERKRGF